MAAAASVVRKEILEDVMEGEREEGVAKEAVLLAVPVEGAHQDSSPCSCNGG